MPASNPTTFQEARELFRKGKLPIDNYMRLLESDAPTQIKFWDPKTEPNPTAKDNNHSRQQGFKWHQASMKGEYFQKILKKTVLGAINLVHAQFKSVYDQDIYTYSDPRLIFLDKWLKTYVAEWCNERGAWDNYKQKFLDKTIDIVLGLMKEDIYYRARILYAINLFIKREMFVLTKEEVANLEKWH